MGRHDTAPGKEFAVGWHGIGLVGPSHLVLAVVVLLVALALAAWWVVVGERGRW